MKKILVCFSALGFVILSASFEPRNKAGIVGFTGAPGEKNCTHCHGGTANTGTGSIVISAPTLTNWKYIPGKTYVINVTVAQPATGLFGFELEALTEAGGDAGTIEVTDETETHMDSSDVSGVMRKSITHNLNGGKSTNVHRFTFNWTAPATDAGPVNFYAAGNAANGNNFSTGDFIYTTTQVVVSSSVDVTEQNATAVTLTLFPNPTEDRVSIRTNANDKMVVSILDLNGRLRIKKENMFSDSFIDVSELPAGIYLTRIKTADGESVKRFVKR